MRYIMLIFSLLMCFFAARAVIQAGDCVMLEEYEGIPDLLTFSVECSILSGFAYNIFKALKSISYDTDY